MSKWVRVLGVTAVVLATTGRSGVGRAVGPGATPTITVPWAVKLDQPLRFRVLQDFANEAVLDKETGLVWQQAPTLGTFSPLQAWLMCREATTGGRMGWRVPSSEELLSLLVKQGNLWTLPPGHPFTAPSVFITQSATQYVTSTGTLVRTAIFFGEVSPIFTLWTGIGDCSVWCVRGGASEPQNFKSE